jgi:mono/diheme cytochrome c family protein
VLVALLSLGSAWVAAIAIKAMPGFVAAPASSAQSSSEVATSPELVDQGHHFFGMSCVECHGDDAHGDEGPDLHNLAISNARIATQIKNGTKGEMPSFAKKYNDRQIAALVSYVRSLR